MIIRTRTPVLAEDEVKSTSARVVVAFQASEGFGSVSPIATSLSLQTKAQPSTTNA